MSEAPALSMAPPPRFHPAGPVSWVEHQMFPPSWARPKRAKGAKGKGLAYERKIQDILTDEYPDNYIAGPWFRFQTRNRIRWCQPDGLLVQPIHGLITIVEIKLQHTPAAWWQLKELYYPVLAFAFPATHWEFNFLEVVKWHDPAVQWPEPYRMCADPLMLQPEENGCHILKP